VASERRTSGIVTPEAVLLEFETAGVASRGLARLIDAFVQAVLAFIGLMVVGLTAAVAERVAPGLVVALAFVLVFGVLFGYPIALEAFWNGRTVGKAVLGLRVVTREGAPIRLRHAAIRAVLAIVEVLGLPFVAVLATALSPANQRVGDLTAGTIVVRERAASRSAVAVGFPPPPGWEAYARTLDVSIMTAAQYQVVRSFLMRVLVLTPEARSRLAVRLANPLARAMKHQPPPGLGPELFLVCAAAAYQVRHGATGTWPVQQAYAGVATAAGSWGAPPPATPAGVGPPRY
jgi:uncharacterized RDD family membrane protein YckC